jgi:hypothetical protein
MKIYFRTNLDNYNSAYFPQDLCFVPRIGESVEVIVGVKSHLKSKKLPFKLKVVNVTYSENFVDCELWYHESDIKMAELNKIDLF